MDALRPTLSAREAEASVLDLLEELFPRQAFVCRCLQGTQSERKTWVFRCKRKGENTSVICKVGTRTSRGREHLQSETDWLEELWAAFGAARNTVPEPIYFDRETCGLVMKDAKGKSAKDLLKAASTPQNVKKVMARAGEWLDAFHQLHFEERRFDHRPHLDRLAQSVDEHNDGLRRIPDYMRFKQHFGRLRELAEGPFGASGYCVTHNDFHTENLIIRGNGRAYGYDFQNRILDVALRDSMLFLQDAFIRLHAVRPGRFTFHDLWDMFARGYKPMQGQGRNEQFFQLYFALNSWADFGLHRAPKQYDKYRFLFAEHVIQEVT